MESIKQRLNSVKEYFRPYKQKIEPVEVFIGTIIFYVLFSMAFFMADHNNLEYTANIINFYNSVIVFFSAALYIIINKPICLVFGASSFLASSLAELVLGTIYYPSRMFASTYAHHIAYSAVIILSMIYDFGVFSIAMMGSYIEFSAIFQSIKRIWAVKNIWFDTFNSLAFFVTRILLWIPMLIIIFLFCETTGENVGAILMSGSLILHIIWSWTQIKNLVKRYYSGGGNLSDGLSGDDLSELYLTENTMNT